MATIYNSQLQKEIREGAKIQISKDKIPSELAEKVVPVMEVNPKLLRRSVICRNANAINSASATLITLDSNMDFYITGANLTIIKDATSTSTLSRIQIVVNGLNQAIIEIAGLTLTADSQTVSISFNFPIKVDRGTSITVTNSTNVANITARAQIFGYYDESSNA